MKNLFKVLFVALIGIFASVQVYGQAVDMVLDNGAMTPAQPTYPGKVSFSFMFFAELGTHEMSSDDLAGNYGVISLSLSKLDGTGITPTGAGADLFTWTYNPATRVYSGKSKDVFVLEDVFYPIIFTNLPTTEESSAVDVGFIANLTPPGDLLASDSEDDKVSIYASSPLPVTLVSFTANKEGNLAQLKWATTEETKSDYFEIQHSVSGKEWAKIGKVASHGESTTLKNYTFIHNTPVNGQNLYRLRMVDTDKRFAYSNIKNLQFDGIAQDLTVYPNPVSDKLFLRNFMEITSIKIHNLSGQAVYQADASTTGQVNISGLQSGMYIVKISRSNGVESSQKIVVRK